MSQNKMSRFQQRHEAAIKADKEREQREQNNQPPVWIDELEDVITTTIHDESLSHQGVHPDVMEYLKNRCSDKFRINPENM